MLRSLVRICAILSLLVIAVPAIAAAGSDPMSPTSPTSYQQTNLVADTSGVATFTDPHLVNPWGIATGPSSPFWINDNGTGLSTLYTTSGKPQSLVVTIPPPPGSPTGTISTPTGIVFNASSDFVVHQNGVSGPSVFIFATEDGTISGWAPNVNTTVAIIAVNRAPYSAVYKGLAIGSNSTGNFLYATNFHAGKVDVYDATFHRAKLAGTFSDPAIPFGYAPFGIQNIGGSLYVTYAKRDAARHDDVPGPGRGFVDVYDTNGNLVHHLIAHGALNAPWGLTLAPATFGSASNALLVGNFGDGRINAYDPNTGALLGPLMGTGGAPLAIDGLWGLLFGNGGSGGQANTLYFTAGPNGETHGLFGSLAPAP